ncbi:hypothetical protein PPSIR1_11145 [Plesiocystis pacifica SIR-1]|uniref:Uncharacterized protein n=1 Tax=Plesiocystis pacifica SIR-1 TaxID=391625 RepID=A6G132_9BACT|nr:hypothetical protein [Plesiocystis pacifica]EDM80327.1 hypothetical protein PPSIR1_11145 [Plesiocystis pacifica SIR-1]
MGVEQMQRRAAAVPKALTGLSVAAVFVVPLVWVIGEDNIFDWTLAWITSMAGEGADLRHLLAYLLCVMILLVPTGVAIQLVGHWRLSRSE